MKNSIFVISAASILFMVSCVKPEVIPPPTPDGNALSNFFTSRLNSKIQTFTANASTGDYITTPSGTTLTIYPNTLLDANNNVVSGTVTITFIEIYNRTDMLLNNKPTVGIMPGGDHAMLVSGGEYYLNITQNGNQLHTNSHVVVKVPTSITGGTDNAMALFRGGMEMDNQDLLWTLDEVDTFEIDTDTIGGGSGDYYQILDGTWGWANVDRFYSDPNPKTTLLVELPEGYNLTNCEVFLAYDDMPGCLAKLDVFTTDGYFSEHYGQVPVGLHVHIIAVTIIDDILQYAIEEVTIADGQIESITALEPTTQAELAIMIDNLP